MRIVSGVLGFALLVLVLCFALSNRQTVAIGLWPVEDTMQVPLYLLALVPLFFGLVFGCALGWAIGIPHRIKARRLHKELSVLNEKIAKLQNAVGIPHSTISFKKPFWKRL